MQIQEKWCADQIEKYDKRARIEGNRIECRNYISGVTGNFSIGSAQIFSEIAFLALSFVYSRSGHAIINYSSNIRERN